MALGDGGTTRPIERAVVDVIIRLAFLGLLIYWVSLIISPFVLIVVWAAILTVALMPVYLWLKARLGGRGSIASLLITLVGMAIVLGPVAILVTSAVESAQVLLKALEEQTLTIPPPSESVKDWAVVGKQLYAAWADASTNLSGFLQQHSGTVKDLGGSFLSLVAGLGGGMLSFAASVIISGFLYGSAPTAATALGRFIERIVLGRGKEFVEMTGATIRNVARGVVGISIAQSILLGIGLMAAGVPAAGLLTFVILVLCIIQIGPTLVVLPTIIWAWSSLDTFGALIFTIYMVICNFGDGAIKPIVMAKGLKTPMLVIFVGVIGGTFAHGLIGLFLGPIVLAIFYDLLMVWMESEGSADEDPVDRDGQGATQD